MEKDGFEFLFEVEAREAVGVGDEHCGEDFGVFEVEFLAGGGEEFGAVGELEVVRTGFYFARGEVRGSFSFIVHQLLKLFILII